eukprot:4251893-Karenia_brevis.AAC.1
MLRDFGIEFPIEVQVDANATMGIIHRRGLGKMRHIDVQDLWLQQALVEEKLKLAKIPGTSNAADIGTKPLTAEVINAFMSKLEYTRV